MPPFADRLARAVRAKGPLCVGLDPRVESLPHALRGRTAAGAVRAAMWAAGRAPGLYSMKDVLGL